MICAALSLLQSNHSRAQLSQSHTVTENIFSKNLNQAFPRKLMVRNDDWADGGREVWKSAGADRCSQRLRIFIMSPWTRGTVKLIQNDKSFPTAQLEDQ